MKRKVEVPGKKRPPRRTKTREVNSGQAQRGGSVWVGLLGR